MDPASGTEQKSMEHSAAQAPITTPLRMNPDLTQTAQKSEGVFPETTTHETQGSSTEEGPPEVEEDVLLTPRIRDWSSTHTPASFSPSMVGGSRAGLHYAEAPAGIESQPEEYFPPAPQTTPHITDVAKEPSISVAVVELASRIGSDAPSLSSPSTPSEPANLSRDAAPENVVGPAYNPESTRPTSVPNFQSASLSRRRDISDYPQYPNQSFAALQKHSAHPHPLRTRTSNPLHELSSTSSNASTPNYLPHVPSGARTTGNTPAQSPGLFSPILGQKPATEPDDGGYSTPMLHPTHLQAPKE